MVYALAMNQVPHKLIGQLYRVTERTIRRWIHDVDKVMMLDESYVMAKMFLRTFLLSDSIVVLRKYLRGDGKKVGGDLETAFRLLEQNKLLDKKGTSEPASTPAPTQFISQQVTAINVEIPMAPEPDVEFANAAVKELQRFFGAVTKLPIPERDADSGGPETDRP